MTQLRGRCRILSPLFVWLLCCPLSAWSLPAAMEDSAPLAAPAAPGGHPAAGPFVIAAGWYDLYLVDLDANRLAAVINIDETAQDIAVTPDGKTAYAATDAGLIVVDLELRKRVGLKEWGVLDSVELARGGSLLISLVCPGETPFQPARPHEIRLIDRGSDRLLKSLPYSPRAFDIFASPDGTVLYASNKVGRTISWTRISEPGAAEFAHLPLTDGKQDLQRMSRVASLVPACSPGGKQLIYGVETPGDGKRIIIWEAELPQPGKGDSPAVKRIHTQRVADAQGAVADREGERLFINCKHHLLIYNRAERREEAWVPLPVEHRWLAVTGDGDRVVLTCTEEEGMGYLTVVSRRDGLWQPTERIDLPGSVNVISMVPGGE